MQIQKVGIDKIGLYVPRNYVSLEDLAIRRGIDPNKFIIGIGQSKMSVPPIEQDIVSMAANACEQILTAEDREQIDQIIFATESSFDYSKACATYLHELLGIQPYAKAVEMKQACYAGTAGVQAACDYVRLRPDRKVLVVMADVARYGLETSGESTQGAGAVAVLVSANPSILALELDSVAITQNDFDFWRPAYSDVALVDGKYSTELYNQMFINVMDRYKTLHPDRYQSLAALYFHMPFTKMGAKALAAYEAVSPDQDLLGAWQEHYPPSTQLNRYIGNIYTASLYASFLSALLNDNTLQAGDWVGLFSYGSGSVAELLVGQLQPNYQAALSQAAVEALMNNRQALSVDEYEAIFEEKLPQAAGEHVIAPEYPGEDFYLEKIIDHKRYYNKN